MGLSVTLGRWLGMAVMLVTLGPTLPYLLLACLLARLLVSLFLLKFFALLAQLFIKFWMFEYVHFYFLWGSSAGKLPRAASPPDLHIQLL